MKIFITVPCLVLAMVAFQTECFTVSKYNNQKRFVAARPASTYFMDEVIDKKEDSPEKDVKIKKLSTEQIKQKRVKSPRNTVAHAEGVFSPLVLVTKDLIGVQKLNKVRAKVISLHSDVIGKFVNTYETPFGEVVLNQLFAKIDLNKDGYLDTSELTSAFKALGFTWLKKKQVNGIMKRADKDGNGVIDLDEFRAELPKTLRTNLIKLAKKNGNDMGLLV